jgi:hypothetical protein
MVTLLLPNWTAQLTLFRIQYVNQQIYCELSVLQRGHIIGLFAFPTTLVRRSLGPRPWHYRSGHLAFGSSGQDWCRRGTISCQVVHYCRPGALSGRRRGDTTLIVRHFFAFEYGKQSIHVINKISRSVFSFPCMRLVSVQWSLSHSAIMTVSACRRQARTNPDDCVCESDVYDTAPPITS